MVLTWLKTIVTKLQMVPTVFLMVCTTNGSCAGLTWLDAIRAKCFLVASHSDTDWHLFSRRQCQLGVTLRQAWLYSHRSWESGQSDSQLSYWSSKGRATVAMKEGGGEMKASIRMPKLPSAAHYKGFHFSPFSPHLKTRCRWALSKLASTLVHRRHSF